MNAPAITAEAARAARFFLDLSTACNRSPFAIDQHKKPEMVEQALALRPNDGEKINALSKKALLTYIVETIDLVEVRRVYAAEREAAHVAERVAAWPDANQRKVYALRESLEKWAKQYAQNPAQMLERTPTDEAAEYEIRTNIANALAHGSTVQSVAEGLVQELLYAVRAGASSTNQSFNEMEHARNKARTVILQDLEWNGIVVKIGR